MRRSREAFDSEMAALREEMQADRCSSIPRHRYRGANACSVRVVSV